MFPQDKLADLSAPPFFTALDPSTIEQLLAELELNHLRGGEILFRAGEAGDSMYIVLSGRLRVSVQRSNGSEEVIREIARGESVGELALLTGETRSATIRAIRDSELAMLSRNAFERAIRIDPTLIRQIAVALASRHRGDGMPARSNIRTVTILPVAINEANTFADLLADALAHLGPTLRVSREKIKTDYGLEFSDFTEDRASAQLTSRLNALESTHRAVVYQADPEITPWTKHSIRQADLILVVGCADANFLDMEFQRLQKYFDSCAITARIELVLLHGSEFDSSVPTPKCFAALGASALHHIVLTEPADVAKLARLITGTAIGLVLSGGGARAFAHIGVIRAMHERGISIDFVGGTSMGAVIAAQLALGWDWQMMARVNREEWPRTEPQKNYTLPLVALNSARRMDQMLRKMFGAAEIQNLRTKFFCVSTNLTTADAKIHREGSLWKAVRASVSIPGIGPPAIENGEILVDGGLVNNLPVDVMRKFCQGVVYAVDVSEQVEFKSNLQESYTVSGWTFFLRHLNPFAEKPDIPNILNTLYRTTTVGGVRAIESAKCQADLCFEPPVSQFGVFDWQSVEKIIDVGYRYAIKKLDEHPKFSRNL